MPITVATVPLTVSIGEDVAWAAVLPNKTVAIVRLVKTIPAILGAMSSFSRLIDSLEIRLSFAIEFDT
jgi:hypothetical protein